jgi:CheY-like chemotaxis protein
MNVFASSEKPPVLLIADDDPAVVRLLADRCSSMGFDVEVASNGIEALTRGCQGGLDTLIIDIHMPELDGLAVCACLSEAPRRPPNMIVATGSRDARTIEKCDAIGAIYLCKGANYWENLQTALTEIYPAKADFIRGFGLATTRATMPARSRVLLVDEETGLANGLRVELDAFGMDTSYAVDAAQAYRVACREAPVAVVCNDLPHEDVVHLLKRLRTTPATRNIPFIVLSGAQLHPADEESLKREIGGAQGVNRILSQGSTGELLETLQAFCGFHQEC